MAVNSEEIAGGYLLHVTPTENLDNILREGLLPQIGARSSELGELVERSYYFTSVEAVEDGLSGWLGEVFDEDIQLSLLLINIKECHVEFSITEGFECEASALMPVAPNVIRVVALDIDDVANIKEMVDSVLNNRSTKISPHKS